jgi:class 3 adenylate cyclase
VVDAGRLVGRHVGDGFGAFFLAETVGSESAAARACVVAARGLRGALADVAVRSDLAPARLHLRFGLHWGAGPCVGQIATRGRSEATALGKEVNEAARIEACATGGQMLVSRELIDQLNPGGAASLGLELDQLRYTALSDLRSDGEGSSRCAGDRRV